MTQKKKREVKIGDVYAVPLDFFGKKHGYVRMYHDPDVAVLGVTSGSEFLTLDELSKYSSVMDVFCLRTAIEKGKWPLIGNIPFTSDENAWPGPRKQVSKIRPDLKLVVYKGHFIEADEFGGYDEYPEFKKFSDEGLIAEINGNPGLFIHKG